MTPPATATLPPPPTASGDASPASALAEDAVGAGTDRYLTFALAGETYALPILDVVEIIEYRSITTVPMMPDFLRGVLNLRGSVVPVIDLATQFGRHTTTLTRRTSILIVDTGHDDSHGNRQRMGILVDAVNKVLHVDTTDIQPPPDLGDHLTSTVIKGMARHDEAFIVILDLDHLLTHEHLGAITAAYAGTPDTAAPLAPPAAGTRGDRTPNT